MSFSSSKKREAEVQREERENNLGAIMQTLWKVSFSADPQVIRIYIAVQETRTFFSNLVK